MTHDFLSAVANKSHGAFVPHVDAAERINSKDWCIGRIDETRIFTLLGKTASDILTDADYTNDVSLRVTSSSSIE